MVKLNKTDKLILEILKSEAKELTLQEIADKLGLDVNDVTEIRCIAEVEVLPADTWMNSDKWKREQAAKFFDKRRLGGK